MLMKHVAVLGNLRALRKNHQKGSESSNLAFGSKRKMLQDRRLMHNEDLTEKLKERKGKKESDVYENY